MDGKYTYYNIVNNLLRGQALFYEVHYVGNESLMKWNMYSHSHHSFEVKLPDICNISLYGWMSSPFFVSFVLNVVDGIWMQGARPSELILIKSLWNILAAIQDNSHVLTFSEFTGHRSHAKIWCCPWSAPLINGWVNNREAGDLRRHHAHYDVIVTCYIHSRAGTSAGTILTINSIDHMNQHRDDGMDRLMHCRGAVECNYSSMFLLQRRFNKSVAEYIAWASLYIPHITGGVITYLCLTRT